MKIVKVTYTTSAAYSEQNKVNITDVMNELRELCDPGIFYHVCVAPNDLTYTHTAFFISDAEQSVLFGLQSFRKFQEQLKASGPEVLPVSEQLSLVGSSKDIF